MGSFLEGLILGALAGGWAAGTAVLFLMRRRQDRELSSQAPHPCGVDVFKATRDHRLEPVSAPRNGVEFSSERGYHYGETNEATVDMRDGVTPGHMRYCACDECWERLRTAGQVASVGTNHWK